MQLLKILTGWFLQRRQHVVLFIMLSIMVLILFLFVDETKGFNEHMNLLKVAFLRSNTDKYLLNIK